MTDRDPILVDAIAKAGGPVAISKAIGVSPAAVSQWRRVPPLRVLDIERLSGISREKLRPDIFEQPHAAE